MKTTVERVDETKVKLSITVEAERVDRAIDAAAAKLAGEVKVPGFRPGRVPRRVLESRLGKGALVSEAVRDSLPAFYAEAAQAEQLEVVGPPEFSVDTFEDGKDAAFAATVEVRPEFEVPAYEGLQVAHPEWEVDEDEATAQLDALRERFAELETVNRPAQAGDYVVVTTSGERNGQPVDEVTVNDLLHELPADAADSESALDRNLLGASAGSVVRFNDTLGPDFGEQLAGAEVSLTALVKEVKVKRLPDLDDDFAITASEFDTAAELRDELRRSLAAQKRAYARSALRAKVVEEVSDLVEVPLPQSLVSEEIQFRLQRLAGEAQRNEMSLEDYFAAAGSSPEQVLETLTADAEKTVKAQLVLDAVGRAAGITVTQEDLGDEVGRQAARLNRPAQELAEYLSHPARIGVLVSDAFRRKAIDHLLEAVDVLSAPPDGDVDIVGEADDGQPPADGDTEGEGSG